MDDQSNTRKEVMKKLLIVSLAALIVATATLPAQAGGDNPWPVIGGVVGGLLLGEALRDNRHHTRPRSPYYYEQSYYDNCWIEYRRVWDPYLHRFITQKVRYCD